MLIMSETFDQVTLWRYSVLMMTVGLVISGQIQLVWW